MNLLHSQILDPAEKQIVDQESPMAIDAGTNELVDSGQAEITVPAVSRGESQSDGGNSLAWTVAGVMLVVVLLLCFLLWRVLRWRRPSDSNAPPTQLSANHDALKDDAEQVALANAATNLGAQPSPKDDDQCEPEFSDFDFGDEPADVGVEGVAKKERVKQGFDLAAPENIDFDDLKGNEQEDLLSEMYQEDEKLSDELRLEDSSGDSTDPNAEKDERDQSKGKKRPQFQAHDEFHVDDLHDEEDLDLSDDTEQDFDTCLEMDGVPTSSDSFGGDVAEWARDADVLEPDDPVPNTRNVSPDDTAVGLDVDGSDGERTASAAEYVDPYSKALLEAANAELEKFLLLNQDLLEDRTYLDSLLQENEKVVVEMNAHNEKLNVQLEQSRQESQTREQTNNELREEAESLKIKLKDALEQPSELQTALLAKMQTEMAEVKNQHSQLELEFQSLTREREQLLDLLAEAEMEVPLAEVAEIQCLSAQIVQLIHERNSLAEQVGMNGHLK